jgi:hypothetical protein
MESFHFDNQFNIIIITYKYLSFSGIEFRLFMIGILKIVITKALLVTVVFLCLPLSNHQLKYQNRPAVSFTVNSMVTTVQIERVWNGIGGSFRHGLELFKPDKTIISKRNKIVIPIVLPHHSVSMLAFEPLN